MSPLEIIAIILAILIPIIIIFLETFSRFFKKSRNVILEFYRAIKEMSKFRHLCLLSFHFVGVIFVELAIFNKINSIYVVYYLIFVTLSYILIINISNINKKDIVNKFEAFKFIITYFIICFLYITLFAFVYYTTYTLNKGQIFLNNQFYNLDIKNSFYLSAVSFLSNYLEFVPEGIYMKYLMILQIFFSELILLAFLFIIFGQLLDKIKKWEKKENSKTEKKHLNKGEKLK